MWVDSREPRESIAIKKDELELAITVSDDSCDWRLIQSGDYGLCLPHNSGDNNQRNGGGWT
jgi:hypothetical protein